ncbi:MAG TPA: LytTR family DNA-binding domain-containing protein [Gemmatimonadales bacterium]|nr:LytTR family DNA-binding domain-containing protein [Gemmatimonadales bacterium]
MHAPARITTLIADDEAPARKRLRDLLGTVAWIEVIGECADGPATIEAVDRLEPALLLLDLQMPGCDGLAVVRQITHQPAIVFTTAYDRYAVAAFELGAIDYLLKPFGRDRLMLAIERFRDHRGRRTDARTRERIAETLEPSPTLSRLFVRTRGKIIVVPAAEIQRFEARDDYSALYTGGHRHLIHLRLADLEHRLDPARFVRVHRSHIVNLDFVEAMIPTGDARLEVVLRDGTRLMASRSRSRDLRAQSV